MYDTIIIGAGPSGLTAAIYLKRAGKNVLILEKETIGGQIQSSPLVENYPGYKEISGSELSLNMYDQVTSLGVDIELEEVKEIKKGDIIQVITDENTYKAKTLIIATGSKHRLLKLDNEENLIGKGIHFCVSCDGPFYKDKEVAVVGGGNSALINALALSDICKKVYIIQNLNFLTGEDALKQKVKEKDNIEVLLQTVISKIEGKDHLDKISITTKDETKDLTIDGMFISIGLSPQNNFLKDIIPLDEKGYIKSEDTTTDTPNIFASGDCRSKKVRQLTTATSDGTLSAIEVINYLNK